MANKRNEADSHDPDRGEDDLAQLNSSVVKLPVGSDRVLDASEEVWSLYAELSRAPPQSGLGFIDANAPTLDIQWTLQPAAVQSDAQAKRGGRKGKVAARKPVEIIASIHQDPSALKTRRGDTSSCVWRASLHLARFLLEQHHFTVLDPLIRLSEARVLELGAGTGVLAALIGPLCAHYTATDQLATLPLLRKNAKCIVEELDWLAPGRPGSTEPPLNVIYAVDCIYNEALVEPLVNTLNAYATVGTVVLVVMELRSSEVTEAFLEDWLNPGKWLIWRVCASALGPDLGNGHYVVWAGQRRP